MAKLTLSKLSHISLNVSDLESSLKFYQDILGFRLLFREELPNGMGHAAGLQIADSESVELLQLAGADGTANAVDTSGQCTRLVLSVTNIDAAKVELESNGIEGISEMEMDNIKMLFFQDPDNRTIELTEFPNGVASLAELHGR